MTNFKHYMNVKLRLYINIMVLIVTFVATVALAFMEAYINAIFPAIVVIVSIFNIQKYYKMLEEEK